MFLQSNNDERNAIDFHKDSKTDVDNVCAESRAASSSVQIDKLHTARWFSPKKKCVIWSNIDHRRKESRREKRERGKCVHPKIINYHRMESLE